MILKILAYVVAGYASLCIIVFFFQRKLLYMPEKFQLPAEQAQRAGMRYWPDDDNFHGWLFDSQGNDVKGTVIVFHGNAGAAHDRIFYAKALSRYRLRVILAEYPGYGGRAGTPGEDVLVKDALDVINRAYQDFGDPLYLWGESLGCGVLAAAVQKTQYPIKGLVLFLPWDTLSSVAQAHYPFLPVKWLIKDQYDSMANLEKFQGKVAIILAGDDEIIPMHHGKKLYDSISAEKRLWVFKGATHNEMPVEPDLPWWKEVVIFISQ